MDDMTGGAAARAVGATFETAHKAARSDAVPAQVRTLPQLLDWRVGSTPELEAYREFNAGTGQWASFSWREAALRIASWRAALARTGLERGSRVAILLPNGLAAVCIDQAALALACVPVPLHALDNPESIAYILADSDAALLVVASLGQWQAIAALQRALPMLRNVVVLEEMDSAVDAPAGGPRICSVTAWLAARAETAPPLPPLAPEEDELAALVYTSGTTGKPKGVMLTHANVVSNVKAALVRVAPRTDDVFLSFLPLSHTFERTAGYYLPIAAGCCVAYARSIALLADDLLIVSPTILISVPRIYERVYAKLRQALAGSEWRLWLFMWAIEVGWRRFRREQALPEERHGWPLWDSLAWQLLEPRVARPVRAAFGGRLRVAVSGGAPLPPVISRCFLGLGLPVLQGYGMTETSPVVAVNAPDDNDPATVGRALPGVELRIAERSELLVRGPSVMRGYWKRETDTHNAFLDGWLRTGDQAVIEHGRLRILGRVKEIIVTSTGEKIAPVDLELAITADPLFEQACAMGDERPFIACVVVLNRDAWVRLAGSLRLDPSAPASLRDAGARRAALEKITARTSAFPRYAQPRAVLLTLAPWTVENTLLTPTLKVKRQNLVARYKAEIDAMYTR
ncbi:long-chain fatty acid--CoA ligase [Ideonella azotifigens]|uniref:AMP-dependent synthetase/ligase n=1 Tax=Ideonella azotifigens TaxID=513160 RepID=A0ABN1KHF3_9BURK|nr:long-chain fatty acid--CoA ligase [Ideonella azotifigens]MCD2344230.1 long-chain fatty acid--CoA ligase [Ideonella azotifigens]